MACSKLYLALGAKAENFTVFDKDGVLHKGRRDLEEDRSLFAIDKSDMTLEKAMVELQEKGFFVASCLIDPLSDRKIDRVLHDAVNLSFRATRKIYPHAPGFCIFIRRWCHELVGGFNEKLMLAEDSDYVLQASKLCRFGLLKSVRILVSVRRLDKDGRFNISMKYLASDAHRIFLGPIESNIFNYQYGYDQVKQPSKTASI